jgi:hypothetical protein
VVEVGVPPSSGFILLRTRYDATRMTNPSEEQRTVTLPADVVSRIEARLPRTEWDDADTYIANVLEEVLYHVESESEDDDYDSVDEQQVQDRLKSLGYLNE